MSILVNCGVYNLILLFVKVSLNFEIAESKTVSWMEVLVLEEKDAGDWAYRGEGACNLVLAYTGSSPSFVNKKHLTISQILCTVNFLLKQALCMCLCMCRWGK